MRSPAPARRRSRSDAALILEIVSLLMAAALAAYEWELAEDHVTVHMPGGDAEVTVGVAGDLDALLGDFLIHYEANIAAESRPFPGAVAALERLEREGARLAVCTNKRESLSRRLLQELDLDRYFGAIAGRDTFPVAKPDPGHLTGAIRLVDERIGWNRIGFGRATGRYFGKVVSTAIFGIGFIMAAFTQQKQALHDIMAGCLVVRS